MTMRTVRRSSIGLRLAVLGLGLVLLAQVTGLWLIDATIERTPRSGAADELRNGELVLQRLLARRAAPGGAAVPAPARDPAAARALAGDLRELMPSLHVALFARQGAAASWQLVAATLQGLDGSADAASLSTPNMRLGEVDYAARRMSLASPGSDTVAVLLRSIDAARAPYQKLQIALAALAFLLLVTLTALATLASHRVGVRLDALSRAAKRLGHGDYDTPTAGPARRRGRAGGARLRRHAPRGQPHQRDARRPRTGTADRPAQPRAVRRSRRVRSATRAITTARWR